MNQNSGKTSSTGKVQGAVMTGVTELASKDDWVSVTIEAARTGLNLLALFLVTITD